MSKKRSAETAWLWVLEQELAMISENDLVQPYDEVDLEKEEVLGEATMGIRRLWTYYVTVEEKAARLAFEAFYERRDPEKRTQYQKEATQLKAKAETAKQIMWISIRDTFDLWDQDTMVGIREDWMIVQFKGASNFIQDILRGLGGEH